MTHQQTLLPTSLENILEEITSTEIDFRETIEGGLQFSDLEEGQSRVDRKAGLVRGVRILGKISANGREYTDSCLDAAPALYEGMRVGVDHIDPKTRRRVSDTNGFLENAKRTGDAVYGDWKYNPKHTLTEQFLWDAENNPKNLGFSHDARGRTRPGADPGKVIVEEIVKVRSVDLVADPATNRTLFESRNSDTLEEGVLLDQLKLDEKAEKLSSLLYMASNMMRRALMERDNKETLLPMAQRKKKVLSVLADWETETKKLMSSASGNMQEGTDMDLKDLKLADLKKGRPDLLEVILEETNAEDLLEEKDQQILALQEEAETVAADAKTATDKLTAELDGLKEEKRKVELEKTIQTELEEANLTGRHKPTDTFLTLLREAKDEDTRKDLIKDRKQIIDSAARPRPTLALSESRYEGGESNGYRDQPLERTVASWRN